MTDWKDEMEQTRLHWNQLPHALQDGLDRYFSAHIETGSFLRAVLENNLTEALMRSHPQSRAALFDLTQVLMFAAPAEAWGSKEKVEAWLKQKPEVGP